MRNTTRNTALAALAAAVLSCISCTAQAAPEGAQEAAQNGNFYRKNSGGKSSNDAASRAISEMWSSPDFGDDEKQIAERAWRRQHEGKSPHDEPSSPPPPETPAPHPGDSDDGDDDDGEDAAPGSVFGGKGAAPLSLTELLGLKNEDGKLKSMSPREIAQMISELKGAMQVTQPIKMKFLVAVEAVPGHMILMSDTGRFVFKGTLYDAYNGMMPLKNINDVRQYALKPDYRRLKLDPDSLSSARLGSGPRQVVIYVDPDSALTHKVMNEIMTYPDRKDFTFYFVVMPSNTPRSEDLAKRFYCAREEHNPEIGNLLYRGELEKLPRKECNMANWDSTITAAYYTDVDVLPFFVAPDGTVSRGIPSQGIFNFLAQQNTAGTGPLPAPGAAGVQQAVQNRITEQEASLEQRDHARKNWKEPKAEQIFPDAEEEEEDEDDASLPTLDAVDPTKEPPKPEEPESQASEEEVHETAVSIAPKGASAAAAAQNDAFGNGFHGFDMGASISNYRSTATPSDSAPLDVNGYDQDTEFYMNGDEAEIERSLRSYTPITEQQINRSQSGDRVLLNSIRNLQNDITKTRNEFRSRRESVKQRYDSAFQNLEGQYGWAMRYEDEKRSKVQASIRQQQAKLFPIYKKQIQDLNAQEKEKVASLLKEIEFQKSGLRGKY